MHNLGSDDVKASLTTLDIHLKWETVYRTRENERFYQLAIDRIAKYLDAPHGSLILDVGCGTCTHSMRLARRGFRCCAVDISESVLKRAETYVREQGLEEQITLQCEDVTCLSFENNSFDYVYCWGVLMHIPDLKKAVAELARVVRPGGRIIIQENNMYSLWGILAYIARKLVFKKGRLDLAPAGIEYWEETSSGPLFTRKANIGYLRRILRENNVVVHRRCAGEFVELYTRLPHPILRKLVHMWNEVWFRFIRLPQLAFGNIILAEKQGLR